MIYSFVMIDDELTWISMVVIIIAGLMIYAQWFVGARTICPLCITPVLGNRRCVKNRNSRKLFSSHRLRVASDILFHNSFHCPYCNEPTVLQVRRKTPNPTHPRG